jgi:glutamine amidotransferase
MSRITVGLVDYGVGNHASVARALDQIGFRCRVSGERHELAASDLMILPGVGAFAPAMHALQSSGLEPFLREQAASGRPLLGICLGMQLLAESSTEGGVLTRGLALVPGTVTAQSELGWHTGWNRIRALDRSSLFRASDGADFYFNHSFYFHTGAEFQACVVHGRDRVVAAVRSNNVVGVQFHPEKSQQSGRLLLENIVNGLCDG